MIIVIDGTAGSGKSSTARTVAKNLGIEYIDSGALYRAVTTIFVESSDKEHFLNRLAQASVSFHYVDEQFKVFVNGKDVTSRIRSPKITDQVSKVAAMSRVRTYVNALMRKTVIKGAYIAEGRDLGTAVFPDAAVKIFMRADAGERAARRFKELGKGDVDITFEEVHRSILARDKKDRAREHDPLAKAADAIVIDTTEMDFDEQVDKVCSIIYSRTNLNSKRKF